MQRKSLDEIEKFEATDPATKFDPAKTALRLEYAWKWFSYHAQQRLTAFHYFLIVVALLTTGYITAVDKQLESIQIVICILGVLISVAFLALDIRNEELVNDGRAALRKLERAIDLKIHRADYIRDGVEWSWRKTDPPWGKDQETRTTHKHGLWLEVIEGVWAGVFLVGLCASVLRLFC